MRRATPACDMIEAMGRLVSLASVHTEDAVGGKAAALGELLRAGFPVPDGFVITEAGDELSALEPAILKAFDDLKSAYVAVRSSAAQEDGNEAAWAGQLDTFLNVPRDLLMEATARCMASANSPRARAYAAIKGIAAGNVAVIVQAMVPSDVSGVCFSVHPITQDKNQMVIEAVYGLGEAIVSGEITPDNYVMSRQPREITSKVIASQPKALRFSEGDRQTTWENVSEPSAQKLSDMQVLELADVVERLEQHFGHPVDVEWAFHDGKLLILQSRPITTLG